jgi:FkbM family methyltransferase
VAKALVDLLGTAARAARTIGLRRPVRLARDLVDESFVRHARPPLSTEVEGVAVRGFLRHRSFLAEAGREGTTYRPLFVASLRSGMTVVDGGAHVGLYSTIAASRVGADGHVLAFEPDPYNLHALEHNVAGRANVRIVRKALAEAPGTADFYVNPGTIGSSLVVRPEAGRVPVELTSVDEELRGIDVRSLLVKLNIEGAELRALDGMRETLERCPDVTMFVELNSAVLDDPSALLRRLEALGFAVYWIDQPSQSLWRIDARTPPRKGHVFCRRA